MASPELTAQDSLAPRSRAFNIYAEIGGNGGIYSINFRKKIRKITKQDFYWSAGFSVMPRGSFTVFDFPVSVNWYKSLGTTGLIFGTGQVLILSTGKGGTVRGTFRVAYRVHLIKWRSSLEFAYTPFYSYIYNFQYENWFGIGFAYHFKRIKK